jgi:multidrug transporter EmrE-like cation transporter
MRFETAAVIVASVALSSSSHILLKRGMTSADIQAAIKSADPAGILLNIATSAPVLLGLACFGLSLLLWLYILSRVPLSSAYPFVSLGILVTAFAGFLLFSEPISFAKAIGLTFIVGGVALVGFAG